MTTKNLALQRHDIIKKNSDVGQCSSKSSVVAFLLKNVKYAGFPCEFPGVLGGTPEPNMEILEPQYSSWLLKEVQN